MEKGLNGEQGHWGILGCVAKHVKPKEEVIVIKIERFTEKREIKTIQFFQNTLVVTRNYFIGPCLYLKFKYTRSPLTGIKINNSFEI